MSTSPSKQHPGDSAEQREAEREILEAVSRELGVPLDGKPDIAQRMQLDGFQDGDLPICVEIWAHQGPAKSAQRAKVMKDMCKLLYVEKLLGRPCRKILAVSDPQCLGFLDNSWQGQFAAEFGIERIVVPMSVDMRERVRQAQTRQYR